MSPLSRGGVILAETGHLLRLLILGHIILVSDLTNGATVGPAMHPTRTNVNGNSPDDIEAFVKRLEYQAVNGDDNSLDDIVKIDFNLLSDDVIAADVQEGLQEEFEVVDSKLGEKPSPSENTTVGPTSRQLSLIYQGVYAPDARFNAFADGVMVNMVAEMKRKRMDPLYFRVYDRGIIEHVAARAGREGRRDEPTAVSSVFAKGSETLREGRQNGNAIGGGVIRGLTNVKRFGNAEVQIAGNTTLIRGHWLTGPLDLIVDYRANSGITRVRTGLQAVQFDTLTTVDRFGAEMFDFRIISPLFDYMPYYGNRTVSQQKTTELVVRHLFSNNSFMTLLMRDSFEIASYDKIIPQFGAESNYYSVLKYLFNDTKGGIARTQTPSGRGVSIPGVPSAVAAYLASAAKSAIETLG